MQSYPISMEISGPMAMWTRPDTGDAPISYAAPTFAGVKGIFESILRLRNAEVVPTRVEICKPILFHTYTTNYGGPLRKTQAMKKGASYQLIATVLVNVCYKLFARVERVSAGTIPGQTEFALRLNNNGAHAYQKIFQRRLERGQCHSIPFLGWKEFVPDYLGQIRTEIRKLDELNLEIPSMLKTCFPDGSDSQWQPTFFQKIVIREGVLHYD